MEWSSWVIDLDVLIWQVDVYNGTLHFREPSLPCEGKLNRDRSAVKQATALSDVAVYAPHHAHTPNTRALQTHT